MSRINSARSITRLPVASSTFFPWAGVSSSSKMTSVAFFASMSVPSSSTYLAKGQIEELGTPIDAKDATLVIFDDELTPAQGKNVEDATGKRVMDRAELILDIFATRARTSEAKHQV